ncbi:hypothetical protein VPH35_139059 [Triticum aestivum]
MQLLGVLSKGISKLHIGTTVFPGNSSLLQSSNQNSHVCKYLFLFRFASSSGNDRHQVDNHNVHGEVEATDGDEKCAKYDPLDPIECLESYLKRVVLENYSGDMADVEFAKFFVLNAKVLEEMKFVSSDSCDHEWKSNQHMWLQVDSRASPDARLEFMSSCEDALTDYKRTHDLSMVDSLRENL